MDLVVKKLAAFFAFAMMVSACLTGDMVQSNSIGISINKAFGVPNIVVGIIVAILTALIVLGDTKNSISYRKISSYYGLIFHHRKLDNNGD